MHTTSIIIATSGRPESLSATLDSLCRTEAPEDQDVEVIVVENGPRGHASDAVASLRHPRFAFKYLYSSPQGKSCALNFALSLVKSDLILLTDDDVRFPANWIRDMTRPLLCGEADVVVGGCRLAPHLLHPWMRRHHKCILASTEYLKESALEGYGFAGVNVAFRKVILSDGPQFDCELGGGGLGNGEDTLLAFQLMKAGYRFKLNIQTSVEHHFSEARLLYSSWVRAARNYGQSSAYIAYHWAHKDVRFARAKALLLRFKLNLRLLFSRMRPLQQLGITEWEFCYRSDIARLEYFARSKATPRKYERFSLHKHTLPS